MPSKDRKLVDRRRRSVNSNAPGRGKRLVTPPVGKRQEVAPKRISVGNRLARYQRQIDLIQRQGNGCRDDDE